MHLQLLSSHKYAYTSPSWAKTCTTSWIQLLTLPNISYADHSLPHPAPPTLLYQVLDHLVVSLLSRLHEGGGGTLLQPRPSLQQELDHREETPAARQCQGSLLGLLSLGLNVGSCVVWDGRGVAMATSWR